MKLTIVGASGLIGTKVVDLLTAAGHEVVAASRSTGVDVLTGEGLADALAGADVLIDVVNSPSSIDTMMKPVNSSNCVARTIEYGTPAAAISRSWTTLARM